jgi:hypothetical protein
MKRGATGSGGPALAESRVCAVPVVDEERHEQADEHVRRLDDEVEGRSADRERNEAHRRDDQGQHRPDVGGGEWPQPTLLGVAPRTSHEGSLRPPRGPVPGPAQDVPGTMPHGSQRSRTPSAIRYGPVVTTAPTTRRNRLTSARTVTCYEGLDTPVHPLQEVHHTS